LPSVLSTMPWTLHSPAVSVKRGGCKVPVRLVSRSRPCEYPATPQQLLMREASQACGIQKGISRADLMTKMKTCIPEFYRKLREV
ncbi:hypothetical protein KKH13_04950, partial [Patescibacteria group bacterium]|nr:hypothetical protein [Patescibacteria group bacterium]